MGFPETRLRRLRNSSALRRLVAETHLQPSQLMWPIFVVPGTGITEPIASMPGQNRTSIDLLLPKIKELAAQGLGGVILFGVSDASVPDAGVHAKKDLCETLVTQAVQSIKELRPNLVVATDVCLCAYTTHGHCGAVDSKGRILNDESLELLATLALSHAKAGADLIAPSDMMDGRVGAIRKTLDANGYSETPIMSYAAKYASAFYGPFRDAAHSAPEFGDRKTYQMNPANAREALREMEEDLAEGADILMVKPATPYLDIVREAKNKFSVPIAAYQVSGEYAMIKAAAQNGWLDEKQIVLESLIAIRRAGADIILSYFAPDVLNWLA